MSKARNRDYDKEFKINAAKLYLSSGRSYLEISRELGIPKGTVPTWVRSHRINGMEAFPSKGNLRVGNAEMATLRKELGGARYFKKALGIFSSRQK